MLRYLYRQRKSKAAAIGVAGSMATGECAPE